MALTVEDGTGITGANSYVSLVDGEAILVARLGGVSADWTTATDVEKESAMVEATQYLCDVYGPRLPGYKYLSTQGTCLPVEGNDARDVYGHYFGLSVPDAFKQAEMLIAAFRVDGNALYSNAGASTPGTSASAAGGLTQDTIKVEGIEVTEKYASGDSGGVIYSTEGEAVLPQIDAMLARYLLSGDGSGRIHFSG